MNDYIFSVCIPVYNTEKYLPRALDSIIHQTFDLSKIEIVVVNDASPNTEECTRIIEVYSKYLFIKYIIHDKNAGTFLARKTAIENSSGKYIFFLDPDDTFELYAFEILSHHIIDSPDYIQFLMYSIEDRKKCVLYLFLEDEKNKTVEDVLQNKALHNIVNKCYNTDFLKKVCASFYEFYSIYAEDYYQSVVIEFYANKRKFIDIPLYNYFRHKGITSDVILKNKIKLQNIIASFSNVQKNLIVFFEKNAQLQYIQYINSYAKEFYNYLLDGAHSIQILMAILNVLPADYRSPKLKTILIYLLRKMVYIVKKCIKNILPYGFVQIFRKLKNNFRIVTDS